MNIKKKILRIIFAIFILAIIFNVMAEAIDITKITTTINYDEIGKFHDGMAWIRHGDKYGYIDESGELVIPMIFEVYDAFFDNSGVSWSSLIYNAFAFSEGLAAVIIDGKAGFIDKTGGLVIPAIYDGDFFIGEWISYLPMFNNGLARVRKDGKFGYIDRNGNIAVPFEYAWAGDSRTGFFTEGLIRVSKVDYGEERKYGFVDTNGNVVIPLIYGVAQSFSNGLAAVTNDDYSDSSNYGFIDKTGRLVIPFKYFIGDAWMGFSSFNEYGFAAVWENQKCGVIDRYGNLVVPFEYSRIEFLSEGIARGMVNRDKEWQILEIKSPPAPKTGDSFVMLIFICIIIWIGVTHEKYNHRRREQDR